MDGDEHLVVDDEVPPVNAPLSNTEVAFESSNSKWWHSLEDFRTSQKLSLLPKSSEGEHKRTCNSSSYRGIDALISNLRMTNPSLENHNIRL